MTKPFYAQTGTVEEWNMAYYRLEDYLRAHHVTNKVHQSQIILRLLQRAATRHQLDPAQPPTKLALEEAYDVIDRWFQNLFPDQPESRASVVGRVAFFTIDATERWPNVFLAEDEAIPQQLKAALRSMSVASGPDLQVSSMVPRPLDAGPVEHVDETWERLGRMSVALLIGIVGLFGAAVYFYFGI